MKAHVVNGSTIHANNDVAITLYSSAFPTNRLFGGCYMDAADGEDYVAEYGAYGYGDDGLEYLIIWHFWIDKKGEEPELSELPWEDCSCITIEEQA